MSTFAEAQKWAEGLTDIQLTAALEEMRRRGAAVAYYDAAEIATMFDGEEFAIDPEDWFDEEQRAALEEVMCDRAREVFERELFE